VRADANRAPVTECHPAWPGFAQWRSPHAREAWVTRLAQYAMTKQGLASALQAATRPATESFPDVYDPIVGALGKILAAAENAGSVRPGLHADDVILLLAGLFQMDPAADWKDQTARLYWLVLAGLLADS
jgi:hypothetical protein